jgi:hypothetical protein
MDAWWGVDWLGPSGAHQERGATRRSSARLLQSHLEITPLTTAATIDILALANHAPVAGANIELVSALLPTGAGAAEVAALAVFATVPSPPARSCWTTGTSPRRRPSSSRTAGGR